MSDGYRGASYPDDAASEIVGASEPLIRDQARALLGKQVRVCLDREDREWTIVEGQLLGFGETGDFEILCNDGMVHYCWPMLSIAEVTGLAGESSGR